MQTMTRWTMVATTLVLAACGGSDSTGPGGGGGGGAPAFNAEVTGDIQTDITGTAFFGSASDGQGQTLHMIRLVESGASAGGVIQLGRLGAAGFEVGSYPISDGSNPQGDGDIVAVLTDQQGGQLTAALASSAGTLTITSSSGTRIAGTFTFQATGASLANPGTTLNVGVSGSFTANPMAGRMTVTSLQVR